MGLKAVLDEQGHTSLSDEQKGWYVQGEDGKFHLDAEGIEDHQTVGALKRAKDREKEERQKFQNVAKNLETQLAEKMEEIENMLKGAVPKSDVDKLEKSYQSKETKLKEQFEGTIASLNSVVNNLLVTNVASELAKEISFVPKIMAEHIAKRLQADTLDGKPITRVLDKEGKPSALTLDELKAEFKADPDYAPIMIGSKAKGGGTMNNKSGGSASDGKTVDLRHASAKEMVEYMKGKFPDLTSTT